MSTPIRFIIILVVFEILLTFVHLAVYATLAAAFGINSLFLEILFVVLALTFVSATVLSRFYNNIFVEWYYVFATYWLGLIHFLFLGGFTFFFVTAVSYCFSIYPSPPLLVRFVRSGIPYPPLWHVEQWSRRNHCH